MARKSINNRKSNAHQIFNDGISNVIGMWTLNNGTMDASAVFTAATYVASLINPWFNTINYESEMDKYREAFNTIKQCIKTSTQANVFVDLFRSINKVYGRYRDDALMKAYIATMFGDMVHVSSPYTGVDSKPEDRHTIYGLQCAIDQFEVELERKYAAAH